MGLILGLTGGIAMGKSMVSRFFASQNVKVIDTDKIVHDLYSYDEELYHSIIKAFGIGVLTGEKIDRKKLSEMVIGNNLNLQILNHLVHPRVKEECIRQIEQSNNEIIVLDVPLLFEAGFDSLCDKILVVYTDKTIQLRRLMKRDNLSETEAKRIINLQMSIEEKIKRADYVINNDYSPNNLKEKLLVLLNQIKEYAK